MEAAACAALPLYLIILNCVELSLGLNQGSLWFSALDCVPKTMLSLIKYSLSLLLTSVVIMDPTGS